jgi:predicted nuclease with TOPRIM domain
MDQALAVSQVELRTAQETRKADLEQMREAKERMARLEAEAKNLRNEGIRQRHETEGVAANAGMASLEVEISRLSEMLDGERERAERLESALNQARDEARILLRQRQAHFSAVAQVIAMTLA